jgi:hypothetical protein
MAGVLGEHPPAGLGLQSWASSPEISSRSPLGGWLATRCFRCQAQQDEGKSGKQKPRDVGLLPPCIYWVGARI